MYTKEKLKKKLRIYKEEHNSLPTKRTIGAPLYAQCKKMFGKWSLALYETFGDVAKNFPWDKELVLIRIQDLQAELGRAPLSSDNWGLTSAAQKYFGSWNQALKLAIGFVNQKRYLDNYLKNAISVFVEKHHRLPLREEFDGTSYPYWESVAAYFEETRWSNIFKHINLKNLPIKYDKKHGTGYVSIYDGVVYLSHQELLIGKYLTNSKIIFEKEVPYENSNFIFDFYLPTFDIYIEYYGLATKDYQNRIQDKRTYYNGRIVWEIFKHDNTIKKLHNLISQGSETIIVQAT